MSLPRKIISKAGKYVLLAVGPILIVSGLAWAYGATALWDATFETTPPNTESVSLGDDAIREFKGTVRDYAEAEMNWGTSGTNTGRLREGAGRIFYDATAPSTLNGTDRSGSNALGVSGDSADQGRLWRDTDNGLMSVYDGTTPYAAGGWIPMIGALGGTVSLINTPRFGSTSGADPYNPLAFAIRSITADTTTDATECAAGAGLDFASGVISNQVFGEAGDACFSVTVDLSTRTYATSRGILIAVLNIAASGQCRAVMGVYRDAIANQVGSLHQIWMDTSSDSGQMVEIAYVTGLTNASHEFALHAGDAGATNFSVADDGCVFGSTTGTPANPNIGSLVYIDLGPEY